MPAFDQEASELADAKGADRIYGWEIPGNDQDLQSPRLCSSRRPYAQKLDRERGDSGL
jgi:hypothetical protein